MENLCLTGININNNTSLEGSILTGGITGENNGGSITNCYTVCTANAINNANTGGTGSYAGGITGENSGSITNCVALDTSVYASGTDADIYAGRVAGHNSNGTVNNCYGFDNMLVTTPRDDTFADGTSVTDGFAKNASWWNTNMTAWGFGTLWQVLDGSYPTLRQNP